MNGHERTDCRASRIGVSNSIYLGTTRGRALMKLGYIKDSTTSISNAPIYIFLLNMLGGAPLVKSLFVLGRAQPLHYFINLAYQNALTLFPKFCIVLL